jgi:formylglycine-generating enzyme required for sulfatase activity
VRKKLPNPWGLYDMHGNVIEWCSDRFGNYSDSSISDPKGALEGSRRAVRGGSWIWSARACRSADRHGSVSINRLSDLGFRVALVAVRP